MSASRANKRRRTIPRIPEDEDEYLSESAESMGKQQQSRIPRNSPRNTRTRHLEKVGQNPSSPPVGLTVTRTNGNTREESGHESEDSDEEQLSPEEEEKHRIWNLFAEEYHDIVVELPLEYQRTFLLLRELEAAQQSSTASLKSFLLSHVQSLSASTSESAADNNAQVVKTTSNNGENGSIPTALSPSAPSYGDEDDGMNPATRRLLMGISKAAKAAIRSGEDKVGLTVALYESVDRHIRRLDADLAKYEDSLIMGLREGTLPSHDAPSLSKKSPPGRTTSRGAIALGEKDAYDSVEEEMLGRRRGPGHLPAASEEAKARRRARDEQRRDRKEKTEREKGMPIDPNEPTYCFCERVSFGEMIGCENDDCAREWFHLECVGLLAPPEGKWYCAECTSILGLHPPVKKSHKKGR